MATEATRRFLWIFLPIAAVLSAIGGYWIKGHSPHEIDRALAKDYARQFAKVRSAAQAMVQLDSCLLLYGLAHDDGFPGDLEAVGPEGSKCTYAALLDTGSRLPIDQPGILAALGPEGSTGYSTVPKGYAGLWAAADENAAVVWTNLSEGYLYSYRPEYGSTPTHFTLVARPAEIAVSGLDAPIPRVRGYFLNESGKIRATYVHREATAGDPEISSCERSGEDCERLWVSPSSRREAVRNGK